MKPAKRFLERAADLSPASDAAKYFLGQTYAKMDLVAEGIQQLEACAQMNGPYKLRAMKLLVQYYHRTERYQDCVYLAEKYIEEKKDDPLLFHYLARALSDLSQFSEADNAFKKTLFFSNEDFIKMTYFYRGLNYYHQEKYSQAIRLYKKAKTMDPKFSFVYYNLALAYDQYYADKNLACDYYQKFIVMADRDGGNPLLVEYAKTRLSELKEKDFFDEGKGGSSQN